jgi:hypothetical protein
MLCISLLSGGNFSKFYTTSINLEEKNYLDNLNSYYITGFVDGEGSFIVSINPNSRYKTGYRVKATFSIGLHKKDLALLKLIKKFFGVGNITSLTEDGVQLRVTDLKELEVIISHFYKYPLMTKKSADFLLFK